MIDNELDKPKSEAERIRNLITQFQSGFHTLDEMPGLILATLDADRFRGWTEIRSALERLRAHHVSQECHPGSHYWEACTYENIVADRALRVE